ncbi:VCBS domain-containing protein [Shewanella xiamenensis]|uniref:VCBS domain-containing protein n=1 Tax=Shewanella xiamenensis TaxID=332186 RepID=UPI000034DD60
MSPKKPLTLSTAKRKSRISAKLVKKSEIAAKKLDKDVAKLKAREFRESEVQNSATPDIVATQSWHLPSHAATQLVNTEESTEQKANAQSTTADIDNRHSTTQTASTDPEKTLLEQQQANAAETQTTITPKFQDYGSSESTHLGQGPHFDDTQPPLVTLSQLPEIGDIKQQIEPTALTVSMARTTLTQSVRPPIISTEQHHTPLSIDEQVTHQSIKEDAPAASISGKLHAHGEAITSLQWTVAEHQGQFGRLDIDPITGEWHYQLDNNAPKTDGLAEGEHQTEQFTVTVSGPNGEQVSTIIVIDVEGSNDLPQILGSHLASINAADALQTVMGQLRSVDPDHNDVITWAVLDGQGQYGQLSINPLTGQWQYQLNNHANATLALVSGQQVTETFTVTATDQSGHPVSQQVSIQVNGADDAAIIQGEMTGLVTEDTQAINGQLTVSGQLSIQDPDKDQAHFSADSLQGQFGYLTIDVNGHWIYNADNTQATIQSLRSGEHLTDTFIIHSADGTAQNITVTINGTDDKAEISGTTSASLTEDSDTYQGMLRANGNLTITDNDHGPHLFTATEQSGQFGTLTIDELGHWTYIADNSQTAIQALKTGESITDTLVVQTQDGTQQTISITINGTDDHSVIRGTSVVRVFEDKRLSQGRLHTDGQLWVSNPDTGRAGFAAEQRQGQFGLLSINSDGHWTYIADNNNPSIQALKHGEFVTETLFVKALDGTTQKIEILIKGADDKAIIGGTDTATLIEDQSPQHGQLQAHCTLTITDPDAGQAQFTALTDVAGSAGYGHFSIDATGNWTYTVDNTLTAIQQLNTGEHLTDSLTISSADGTNHTLTVTITGSNDAPVVTHSLVTTTATEDTAFSFSIPAGTFADIDTGDTLIFSTGSLPAWLHFDAATGTFSGTPTNGDVGTSQVTITATDGSGAQVSTIFVLNVGNTNDAPTLTHIATVNATEDGAQVTGQFTATDPDSGDTLTFSIAQPVDGLTVNTDGSWRFDPSHASYQHLAAGQTLTLTIPVTVTDAAGATGSQDLVIKLNGSNDGATIGGISTGSAKEDNAQITTGQLSVADVDDGEAHFVAQTDTAGTYGHFSLSADGRWGYQLDNSMPEIQQLSEGMMLHENFNVHSADGTTHTITVDIVGTNDAPVLSAQRQSVSEDGAKLSGQMVATDVDTGDSQTFSTSAQTAGFTLNADGSYSFAPTDAAYQHLATGQTETLTIPITVTDSSGATSTANLTITLTGSNDGAVISGTNASAVTEDTQLTTQGQLTVTDIDDQESAFTAQANTAGSYGSFTLAADGRWTYTLDNKNSAVQALGQNATLTDSLTVQSVDGTTHTITVTINGHDDGAVIAGVDSGAVTEDANLTAGQLETHGQLTITDPDAGQDHFTAQPHVAGSYGTFSLDQAGHWTYVSDNSQTAIQQLKAGETLTDSLTVQSVGGTTHTVTITLTGSNDAPVLTAQSESVSEDGNKLSGQMVATDVDTGDTLTFSLANAVDGFTLNADGSYSFDPSNAAYQHLAAGQTQTLTIPVSVTDSEGATVTQQLVITVTGSNDGAIISGTDASAVTEDTQLTTQGQLTVTDIDDQESAFTAQANTAGSYGSFTLAADGHWTYTLDNKNSAVQALGQNGTLTDSLTAQSVDGTTHTVTVTINGHDDGAVIAGVDSGAVTEDANLTAGQLETRGQLTISDPDVGQDHFTAQPHVAGSYGMFSLDADGQWYYSADNSQTAIQQLKAGETLTDSLTVQSVGGTTHTVTVTITGSNDAPVLTAQSQSITEDGSKLSGQMVATDVDTGDTLSFSLANAVDGFTLNADGSYSFDPSNAAYQHLAAGQTETLSIPITVTDSSGATSTANLTITLTGSNDGALISGTDTGAVTEDTQLTTSGQLTVTDIDDQESAFTAQAKTAGSYGSFTLAADGHWTYTLDNKNIAVQALGQNAILTDSLTVQSVDGTTHTVTVTINGHDDGAVITGVDSGTVTEDANLTAGQLETHGQLTISDPDAGQDHFTAQTHVAGSYGMFSLDADGQWYYSADNSQTAIQQLKAGETLTDSLTVQSVGGTTHTVTVTITGSNDAPVLTAQSQSITEDGSKLSGQMVATDVDTGDTLSFSLANAVDGFTLNADGSYSFAPANATYQHLAAGQTETLTIPITVTDSTGATSTANLTITLTGSNDGALISGTDAGTVTEDTQLTTQGQLTVTDIDDQESAFTTQANTAGSYGSFTLATDGHWTYTLDNKNSAVQALGQNATLTDSLTVQSVDGTTHTVTVTINGHDDGAVIAGVDSGTVTEDANLTAGQLKTRGQLTISDPDADQDHFTAQTNVAGSYGTFSLDQAGHWTYVSDNSQTAIQQLKAGETLTDSLTVQSVGGTTHTVTVTITGSNDAPVLTAQSQSVTEDGSRLSGQMVATDVDTGDTLTFSLANAVDGFTLNADGSYSFDPTDAAYQHLAQGQTETLSIPITATDSAGATSTANLTITLTGSNDGAVISGTDASTVTEDTQLTTGGQLTVTDIDDQESAFTAQAKTAGSYGSFTLAADGHWTYTLDNSLPAVQALGQNAILTDSLTVQSVDGTTHKVTVTINGHDDGALIAGIDSGTVTEDANLTAGQLETHGQLTISDPDAGQDHFTAQTNVAGSYGSFSLDADGQWHYSADNSQTAIQQLKAGETLTDSLTVQSVGGTTHTVTVTITGSNDAPVLIAQSQSVTEDGSLLSGQMVATDVDTGDTLTFSLANAVDGFTLNADGSYSFDPSNAAYQHLAAGQTQTLTIPVSVTDSTGATSTANLTITLTGSNDGAIISGTDASAVTEDTLLTTQGQLTVTDIDDQESAFTAQVKTAGSYGSFTLAADGHWTYTLDNSLPAVQALGQNATLTDSLTVQSVDGTTHTITVTINGHDDGAVIAGVDSGTVTEDANLTAGQLETRGQLTITDPDAGQDHFTAQPNVAGSYGMFSLDADGQWHYSADNSQTAIQQLKAGETLTDSLTVQSVGGTTHTVTVTLTGTNDAPTVTAGTDMGSIGDACSQTYTQTQLLALVHASDVDHDTTLSISSVSIDAQYGTFSRHGDNWVFTPITGVTGDKVPVTITVSDGTTTSNAQSTLTIEAHGVLAIDSIDNSLAVQTTAGGIHHVHGANHPGQSGHWSGNAYEVTTGDITVHGSAVRVHDGSTVTVHLVDKLNPANTFDLTTTVTGGLWTVTVPHSQIDKVGNHEWAVDVTTTDRYGTTLHTTTEIIDEGSLSKAVTEGGTIATLDLLDGADGMTVQNLMYSTDGKHFSSTVPGGFIFSQDSHSLQIDPTHPDYDRLAAGATHTIYLKYDISETVGSATQTVHQTALITFNGTNDAPVISAVTGTSGSITEDSATTTTSGTLTASDVDAGSHLAWSIANTVGTYGSVAIDADSGQWTYTIDNHRAATQGLAGGQSGSETFTITVTDEHGATATQTLTIAVAGTNDGAVISGVDSGTTTEDASQVVSGQLTVSDTDNGEAHFNAQIDTAGTYGSFNLDTDGLWAYQLDNNKPEVQALKTGQHVTDTFTVTSADGTTHQVIVTIAGKDDGAMIGGADQGRVTEDLSVKKGQLQTSGQLSISDPDLGQAHFTVQPNTAGTYGHFSLSEDGQWSYRADNHQSAIQQLKAGATLTDSFTVTSADGTNHTVTVTLTGSNDAPVLTAQSQSVTEDGSRLSGQMVATDVDTGDTLTFSLANAVDGFTLNADGSYNFDPSHASYQHLSQGQTETLTIPVTVTDSAGACSTQNLTITLTGTNDSAKINDHGTPGQIKEDQHTAIEGNLSVSDTDSGESVFSNQEGSSLNGYGNFILTPQANGQAYWRYTANHTKLAIQQLNEGQILHDSFTVHSADGTTHTITVDIVGTNDAPVLTAQSQSVTEDGSLLSGQMVATDVDTVDTLTFSLANAVDGFTLNADGSYSFDPSNAAYQHLAAGQTQTLTIPVSVTDSTGATSTANLTITLTGSNDGAVISGTDASAVTEDTQLTTQGQLTVTDIDDQESAFTAQVKTAGSYGSFTLAADGHWTYTLDNKNSAVQALGQNATLTDSLTVQSVDGTTHTITVTINGHDDGAVIAGVDSGAVTEDSNVTTGKITTSGQLTISDPDAGQDHFTAQTHVAGSYGTFSLDQAGHWTYVSDNNQSAIQQLKAGETLTDSLTVQSVGGTTHTVTITLTGSNDAPVLTAQSQSVTEDGSLLTGQMVATDVDTGDTLTFSLANSVDGFTLNADGSYSFDPTDAAYQHLAAGQTETLSIPITVTDSAGATSTANLTITLTGSNDGAVISGTDAGTVTEDTQLTTQGQLTVTDIDDQESAFTAQANTAGNYGSFTLAADGHWTYTLDNKNSAVQALGQNGTLTDSLTVQSVDGTTHTITVTINGHDDGAVIAGVDSGAVTEDSNVTTGKITTSGQLTISDPDAGQDHFTAQTNVAGSYGMFSLDADGQWHYSADNSQTAIQQLKAGETLIDSLAVQSVGGTTHTVTITINGHDDGAVIAGVDSGAVTEDANLTAGQLETHGQLIISDPDAGQDHFTAQTNVAGSYGTFSLDADGQWRYSADNSQSAIQQLKTGETLTDSFTVTSADGTNHAVTVTLTGSNDAPVLTAQSQSVSEDGAKLTGQMVVTDVDTGDTLSFSLANGVDGFTLNTDGSYSFDPASAAYQHLAQGQTETLTIPITVTDSTGATSTANLTITLTGTNDGATISGVDTGRVIEDQNVDAQGLLHASGQLQIQDADAGQSNFVAQSGVATQYGHFSIDAQGVWSYTVDNNKPEVQALKPGGTPGETGNMAQALGQALVQSTMEGFHAVGEALTQGQSGALAGVLDLTVQGAAIVLSGPSGTTPVVYAMDAQGRSTLGVDELLSWLHQGAGYEIHLQGSQSDVQFFVHDRGDESVLHGLPLSGSAMLTTPESAAAHLALTWHTPPVPSELSEVVSVTSIDGTTHQITLSIQGTAEDAVITGTDSGRVTEDQNLNAAHQLEASGQLQVTDTDPGQAVFQPIKDLAGHYGNLTMDKDGAWVYHADNNSAAVQALVKGQTVSDSFVVHSFDGTAHTINVTLEGVDETYLDVMAHVTNSLFNQWNPWSAIGSAIASGNIANLNDIELSFGGGTPTVIDANGHVLESFTNKDYFGTHIPLGHLVELLKNHHGAQLILEGAVGTSSSFYVNNTGNPLQLNYAGLVRYNVANNTLGSVPNHSPLTLQATVATGNHAAVLAGADSGSVLADGNTHLQTQGHLTVLDVDGDQAHFTPLQDIKGQYGQFSIDAQGHWHYQADGHQSALQQLTAGKALSDTFTVTSADGTAHTVTVQLFGSNQNTAAIISGADNGKLTEDGTQSQIGGQLSVVDPDTGEAHFIAQADAQGQYGQFSIDEQGTWQYRLDNADPTVQALKAGETLTDLLTVHSADGSSHVLRITVEGSNDAPVMQAQSQSVTEDGGLLRGQMAALDVDRGDVLHFFTAANIPGFVLHDDGSYSFDPSHQEYQSLTNGQVRNIAIPVVVTDSSGARASQFLTLHITGQNDGAVISGDDHASVQVQVNTQATGQLLVSDADLGQDHFQAGQYKGDLDGTLTLDAQGHWQYQLNEQNAFVQHQTDKSYTFESFTVKSADGSSHEIRIEVHGAPSPSPQPQQTAQGNFGAYMAQDIYDALQPAIDGAGYQYRDLAKAFATGDMQPFSNMELSIAGVHIQIVTPSGQLQQTISPTGTDNAAVLSMTQLMQLHSQGYGILVSSDSGLDTARMWLHNTGDPHNIHVEVNGVGFTGWSGPYTFGELQLHAQTSSQSSDEANFETIDSVNLDVAEPATLATSAHDLDSASSGHLNVSSVNYDASLLMGSVDEQTAQTNPAQDKSVDTTLFEGGNFSAQATTSPIDHYLQMVGLMPNSIEQQPTAPIELATLNTPSSTFQDMDTDMLDMVTINHFENPLIEEHKTPHLDQYGFQGEHAQLEVNPNDDDLLHSALNDMHNQM